MSRRLLDGRLAAEEIAQEVAGRVAALEEGRGLRPHLSVVLVGDNPASHVYVRAKAKAAERVGIRVTKATLAADTPQDAIERLVERLNADPDVHGILVQLPLPAHLDADRVLAILNPCKDVDGFTELNAGKTLYGGRDGFEACTPQGCMKLIQVGLDGRPLAGLDAVVIGRSRIVGTPMAALLMQAECTVSVVHKLSRNIPEICRRADIIVAAAGSPFLVKSDWVKPGAIVIDVGINRVVQDDGSSQIVGDVDFANIPHAGAITPVPGGVGPMTIACLLANVTSAAERLSV